MMTMPIQRKPEGKYIPAWRDAVAHGRARKRAAQPKRDILMVRGALEKLKLRHCQEISFWNPLHVGKHGDLNGGLQWVDFVVWTRPLPLIILLDDPTKRTKDYEKAYLKNKKWGLADRGLPVLVLPAHKTSQEYWITIHMHLRKNKLR